MRVIYLIFVLMLLSINVQAQERHHWYGNIYIQSNSLSDKDTNSAIDIIRTTKLDTSLIRQLSIDGLPLSRYFKENAKFGDYLTETDDRRYRIISVVEKYKDKVFVTIQISYTNYRFTTQSTFAFSITKGEPQIERVEYNDERMTRHPLNRYKCYREYGERVEEIIKRGYLSELGYAKDKDGGKSRLFGLLVCNALTYYEIIKENCKYGIDY